MMQYDTAISAHPLIICLHTIIEVVHIMMPSHSSTCFILFELNANCDWLIHVFIYPEWSTVKSRSSYFQISIAFGVAMIWRLVYIYLINSYNTVAVSTLTILVFKFKFRINVCVYFWFLITILVTWSLLNSTYN